MSWYRKPSMETDKAFEGFPEFDIKQMEREANSLFKPYIFFHKDRYGADWWCSRCMSSGRAAYIARTQTSEEQSILWAAHNKEACCPKCRKWATAKNTARTGKGKNLLEYHPIVYLREKEGDLYALAFWTRKDYNGPWDSAPRQKLSAKMFVAKSGKNKP